VWKIFDVKLFYKDHDGRQKPKPHSCTHTREIDRDEGNGKRGE